MKKPSFINNEIYHVYNRGVEKRNVFLDNQDHFRFINCLAEFNDINNSLPSNVRYLLRNPSKATADCLEVELLNNQQKHKKPLVEISAFCLMPNHYHLLVKQLVDNGVPKFMQKIGTGYTNYFNLKNKRVGSLFQGRFKAILVDNDEYLRYLSIYIQLNPLDLVSPEWREKEIKNVHEAIEFLKNYRWSSYLDYSGKENFPLVINKNFLTSILEKKNDFKKHTEEFINSLDLDQIRDLTLE